MYMTGGVSLKLKLRSKDGEVKDEQDQKMYVGWMEGSQGEKMHDQWVEESLQKEMHAGVEGDPT